MPTNNEVVNSRPSDSGWMDCRNVASRLDATAWAPLDMPSL